MSTIAATRAIASPRREITPEELLAMPDGGHYELIDGELRERSMSLLSSQRRLGEPAAGRRRAIRRGRSPRLSLQGRRPVSATARNKGAGRCHVRCTRYGGRRLAGSI